MWIFRCAIIILASTYILTASYQITNKNYLTTGLAFLLTLSSAIAGKIIYDRYQQIHILGSLTPNPNVTSFANKIASFSASFLSLGFLVYFFLFLFKSDYQYITTALNIFVCGFGTLYIWMQCILTTYLSTLFYNRNLLWFRQCLANVSFPILLILTIFGTVASFLPQGGSGGVYFCYVVTSLCTNVLVAIFCVFILTFWKEYEYFATGLRSELLLDDGCTLSNGSLDDVDSIFGTQDLPSSARVIKGSVGYAGVS